MRIRIPGTDLHVRVLEPVETKDSQYHVVDTGLEYSNGGIDSVVTGVAAHSLKEWAEQKDADSLKKRMKKEQKAEKKRAKAAAKAAANAEALTQPEAKTKTTRSTKTTKATATA